MSLQFEMVNCGDCKKCLAGGRVHGPYWYRYYRSGGKMVSEYVGSEIKSKDATSEMPEGSKPEDLYPERVERMRDAAKSDGQTRYDALPPDRRNLINSIVGMKAEARRAYRRSRKPDTDAGALAADLEEQRRLKELIAAHKASLRETPEIQARVGKKVRKKVGA